MSEKFTLSQVTETGATLLIDAASARVQVALLRAHHSEIWETQIAEAGTAIFACTDTLLARASLTLRDIKAFIFCDGPGSVLGIRTAATALRTWCAVERRPVYAYCGLDLLAHFLVAAQHAHAITLIADARRDTWHTVRIDDAGIISPMRRTPTSQLPKDDLVMPEHFRNWTPLPAHVRTHSYELSQLVPQVRHSPLLITAPEPDAFLHEEPSYQLWTPQIHQAEK